MPEIDVAALGRLLEEWSLISVDSALLPDNQDEYDRVRHELFEALVNATPDLLDVFEAAKEMRKIDREYERVARRDFAQGTTEHLGMADRSQEWTAKLDAALARLQGSEVQT